MNSNNRPESPIPPDTENTLEWKYAPPPTPYDLVRDSWIMQGTRLSVHLIVRWAIRLYNGLEINNYGNIVNNWPCIIVANHSSHLDTMAIIASLPSFSSNHMYALAAKDYFFRNSFTAFFVRLLANVIPLDRTGGEMTGLKLALQKMQAKNTILIFPEGTRTTTGEMGQFQKGAVMLSRKSRTPIIPVYIQGTRESLPKSSSLPKRVRIVVTFGDAVRYWEQPLSGLTDIQATQDMKQRMKIIAQSVRVNKGEKP